MDICSVKRGWLQLYSPCGACEGFTFASDSLKEWNVQMLHALGWSCSNIEYRTTAAVVLHSLHSCSTEVVCSLTLFFAPRMHTSHHPCPVGIRAHPWIGLTDVHMMYNILSAVVPGLETPQ